MGRATGGLRWRAQVNSEISHPNLCPCQGWFGGMWTLGAVFSTGCATGCVQGVLGIPVPVPVPHSSPSHGSPPALGTPTESFWSWHGGEPGSSFRCSLHAPEPISPALRGLQSHAGSQGLLPALLLVGGLWMPVWLTQPLALGKAFVSAAESVHGGEGAWPGLGQLCPHSPGFAEPSLSPQSCASSEDDSLSFRSRAASCATDSTSEDALSIRSEMIQRKGTGWGLRAGGLRGAWGAWQGARGAWQGAGLCLGVATSQCRALGALGRDESSPG